MYLATLYCLVLFAIVLTLIFFFDFIYIIHGSLIVIVKSQKRVIYFKSENIDGDCPGIEYYFLLDISVRFVHNESSKSAFDRNSQYYGSSFHRQRVKEVFLWTCLQKTLMT